MAATRKANHLLKLNFTLELSLETQEWSVGLGKRWLKFSRTDERGPGMLLLTNQFHKSFECLSLIWAQKYYTFSFPIGGQDLSCCFHDLLIQRSLPVNSTVTHTCLARAGVTPREIENNSCAKFAGKTRCGRRCANNKSMKLTLFSL